MVKFKSFLIGSFLLAGIGGLLPGGGQRAGDKEILCRAAEMENRGPAYSLAWSPDALYLAAAGHGQVAVFDNTGRPRAVLSEPESFVWSVAFSADGSLLAAADQAGSVWIYETTGWKTRARLRTGFAYSLAFAPDGRLAVGTETGEIQIWDPDKETRVHTLEQAERILSLSWSYRRGILAAGLWNGELVLLEGEAYLQTDGFINTGSVRRDVNGLIWSPDGRRLAAAHQDARIRIYQPGREAPERVLTGHTGWVRGVSWSPDGKLLASGGNDRKLRLYQARRGRLLATLERQTYPIWSVAFAPREGLLATGNGLYGEAETGGRVTIYTLLP